MKTLHNKKIKDLLDTARELFWRYGIRRVSIEEICKKAGVSKMTFYRHFNNKTDLAKAVFEKVADEGLKDFRRVMTDNTTSVSQKVEKMLKLKLEGTNEISREFLQDFYTSPESDMVEFVQQKTSAVWEQLIEDFRDAQNKGLFRKDFSPHAFFIIATRLTELYKDEQLLSLYNNPQELVMELTKFFTYGIMPYNENAPFNNPQ